MVNLCLYFYIQSGAICLHAAAMKGHTNVVRALLQKGAAPDAKTKVGQHTVS